VPSAGLVEGAGFGRVASEGGGVCAIAAAAIMSEAIMLHACSLFITVSSAELTLARRSRVADKLLRNNDENRLKGSRVSNSRCLCIVPRMASYIGAALRTASMKSAP
jgi:hypothetical protein